MNGAGAAGSAITKILLSMGAQHVLVCDRKGILYRGMDGLDFLKEEL